MEEERKESFPLHRAFEYRIVHKINILLPKTQDINKKNDKGYSVLHIACELHDYDEILDILLTRKDIDITVRNNDGYSALHILAYQGNFKGLVKVLKAFPDVDIDMKNDKGNTPLMMACKKNYIRIIEYLLAKGADVTIENVKKYTALHYAANNGYVECVEMLLENGAKVDAIDDFGLTPLMKASKWGFTKTCETLLKHGANINQFNRYMTALSSSCYNDTVELTKLLIAHKADIHFPGPYSSALIACARLGSYECAKELIKAGVKVHGKMKNGKSAADIARENGHRELAALLSK